MGYEIKLSFEKWHEFLNFMTDLHNREMQNIEEVNSLDKNKFRFEKLEDIDEDMEELMQQYPVAFEDTLKNAAEIKRIHLVTEKMAKRPKGYVKPASAITTTYILSRIKKTFTSDKFFLALPLTIAALFRIKCGNTFEDSQTRTWQDLMDLNLFLLNEYGFKSKGVENALEVLDEYNLLNIDKDYTEDKENPKITYQANDELCNLLITDEEPF
ncbi:hypothetical protein Ga0466249_001543 [Sporomusaceae bacterium BoRhaA]|uniref:hypothetical protein n=1 Tax=Pelorhabdus rhamnosifermentans TaxID=2772457 RepID=UPI001C061E3F|nr:hypothetical protein [Pelorhabdus rhamnosifermentans]MBU2700451.1 hypothetical protein [Pelorhabdus rhamnosifermentans]